MDGESREHRLEAAKWRRKYEEVAGRSGPRAVGT